MLLIFSGLSNEGNWTVPPSVAGIPIGDPLAERLNLSDSSNYSGFSLWDQMIPTPVAKLASDSITSPSNPGYRPLDIDTLYYTRSIYALRWSADNEHLYFETNITGR